MFNRIFAELASKAGEPDRIMIDATHLKAHRTAASLLKGGSSQTYRAHQRRVELQGSPKRLQGSRRAPRRVRRRGTAHHALAHRRTGERPQRRFPDAFSPATRQEIARRHRASRRAGGTGRRAGYDSDWFRAALTERGITPCIPPRKNRKVQYHYDKVLYRQRHKIDNVFARIKDWRRVAARYDRCAHTFMSAISIAATVCYWL